MNPALTQQQKDALKSAILAEPNVAAFLAAGDDGSIAAYYNGASATSAWKTAVGAQTLDEVTPWTAFDTLDATAAGGKKLSWLQIFNFPRNMTKGLIRQWVTDVWGAATAGSNAEKILQACTEFATRAEAVLGGTTKTTGTVSAIERVSIGQLAGTDIAQILRG